MLTTKRLMASPVGSSWQVQWEVYGKPTGSGKFTASQWEVRGKTSEKFTARPVGQHV